MGTSLNVAPDRGPARRGSALLAVLWLVAALSAIAFSVATTVRSETSRVSASVEGLKAQYLASGAVERAILYVEWSWQYRQKDGTPFFAGNPRFALQFPSGQALVEVLPETAKLNVNTSPPEDLLRLLAVLGVAPGRAQEIVAGILEWRTPIPMGGSVADLSSPGSSFLPRHASFEEIEELLQIKGVTPELFYGTCTRDAEGRLKQRAGLLDCLSVYGGGQQIDVNGADPVVLMAVGVTPQAADAIVRMRAMKPFQTAGDLAALGGLDQPGFNRLTTTARSLMVTVRATAQPRLPDGSLSDTRRSAAALVTFLDPAEFGVPHHILRWYGNVWVQ